MLGVLGSGRNKRVTLDTTRPGASNVGNRYYRAYRGRMPPRDSTVCVRVPDALRLVVVPLAQSRGTTLSDIVRGALVAFVSLHAGPGPGPNGLNWCPDCQAFTSCIPVVEVVEV